MISYWAPQIHFQRPNFYFVNTCPITRVFENRNKSFCQIMHWNASVQWMRIMGCLLRYVICYSVNIHQYLCKCNWHINVTNIFAYFEYSHIRFPNQSFSILSYNLTTFNSWLNLMLNITWHLGVKFQYPDSSLLSVLYGKYIY